MSSLVDSLHAVSAGSVTAAVAGVLLGVAMFTAARTGARFVTPEAAELGIIRALAINIFALVIAFGVLLILLVFARSVLAIFGIGLVTGFVVPSFVALFTMSGVTKAFGSGR